MYETGIFLNKYWTVFIKVGFSLVFMVLLEKLIEKKEKQKAIIRIQSIALKAVHDFFFDKDYEQLMPVILSPITDPLGPDPGSSVIKVGEIEYLGQKLQLTQSMILHKQIAIGMGIDKFYIISPNVRLEDARRADTGVHAFEFSQIDFEIRGAKMKDIFRLVEQLLRKVIRRVKTLAKEELEVLGREFPEWNRQFSQYSTHELEEKYGPDWEYLASVEETTPFWVICHKREFYDKVDRESEGEHYLNYDLYYPEGYLEALSGAEREHEYGYLLERIAADGFKLDMFEGYLTRAAEGKLFASAGGGLGVERLIRYLVGADHIRDVMTFPRIPGETLTI